MSFDIEQEFSMFPGRADRFKERVMGAGNYKGLKFCALYGANAAGKSNLVYAFDISRQIIVNGIKQVTTEDLYCKNAKGNIKKATKFEYEICIDDMNYAYGFKANLDEQIILEEWLYKINKNSEKPIFERSTEAGKFYFDEKLFDNKEEKEKFQFYIEDVNEIEDALLLTEVVRRKDSEGIIHVFKTIYEWFKNKLVIIYPGTVIGESYLRFSENEDNAKMVGLLKYFDTGIVDYKLQKVSKELFKTYFTSEKEMNEILSLPKNPKNVDKMVKKGILRINKNLFEIELDSEGKEEISKLLFYHLNKEELFEYGEESDGTRRLIELLDIILNYNEDKTYIIDELDRSLHPQMTKKFVETFFEFSKKSKTQLVITTHESNLMDLKILRQDEIWFAERDFDNCTKLFSLDMFKERYDKVVAKSYLQGRYGAVPVFGDFEYCFKHKEE